MLFFITCLFLFSSKSAIIILVVILISYSLNNVKAINLKFVAISAILILGTILFNSKTLAKRFLYFGDETRTSFIEKIKIHEPRYDIWKFSFQIFQENKSYSKGGFANNPYQMVERDFAFLFPKEVKAGEIIKKVKKIDKNIIQNVTIFDVYDGDKLPENKKSIAFRVLLQPQDKTFNDQEIEELSQKIIDEISKSLDASIRN